MLLHRYSEILKTKFLLISTSILFSIWRILYGAKVDIDIEAWWSHWKSHLTCLLNQKGSDSSFVTVKAILLIFIFILEWPYCRSSLLFSILKWNDAQTKVKKNDWTAFIVSEKLWRPFWCTERLRCILLVISYINIFKCFLKWKRVHFWHLFSATRRYLWYKYIAFRNF